MSPASPQHDDGPAASVETPTGVAGETTTGLPVRVPRQRSERRLTAVAPPPEPAGALMVVEGETVIGVAASALDLRPAMTYSRARLIAGDVTLDTDRPVRLRWADDGIAGPEGLDGATTIDIRLDWGHFVIACDGEPLLERIAPARLRITRQGRP